MPKNRTTSLARVGAKTPDKIKEIAHALGLTYNQEGSIGKLLDAIASGEIILIKRNKSP